MKKIILFTATVDLHFQAFHIPFFKWFKQQGWEVHVASAGDLNLPYVDVKFTIPIERSPFNKKNLKAYRELRRIIEENQYKIIHCHTPIGGVITRIAAKSARKHGTKVYYTAHGFHFCKKAPLINWAMYYPIEKLLSNVTDCLITINKEDYHLAINHHFKARGIYHVHGVGVDTERFRPVGELTKNSLRLEYGYKIENFLMFYAAEFNKNKNQRLLIESLAQIKEAVPNAKLLLAGDGPLLQECIKLTEKLGVESMVEFLGYRNDIESLLKMSDLAVASSLREGLPVNVMEAMACGLAVVANDNRGHRELIQNNKNGWIIKNKHDLAERIIALAKEPNVRERLGKRGCNDIISSYSVQNIINELSEIYKTAMEEERAVQWALH
jgi:glycosyltransferase EpsD